MNIVEISDLNDIRLAPFASLTERQMKNNLNPDQGLFIAESPKVIRVALRSGRVPVALLCERKHIDGDARDIVEGLPDGVPVFTGSRELLSALTGYTLTRGVLCAMRREPLPSLRSICGDAQKVCVIHDVTDTTNIGAIFRSAAALEADAVVLSSRSCDPLNRRAVRVSMGTVFSVPWTVSPSPVEELKELGFTTMALALREDSTALGDPALKRWRKVAIVLGTEGDGLPDEVISQADMTVKIPMREGVDSLNVAAASAVAMWELFHSLPPTPSI